MMHHPNMHHGAMSGHPTQHMPHQGMPTHQHHQMPPHQMHRENRHVTLTRVPLGPPGQAGGGLGGHGVGPGGGMGGMGGMPVHHAQQRPPHPIRAMPHHPQPQHHSVPPQQMKPVRRQYVGGASYGGGAGHMPPVYEPLHSEHSAQPTHTGLRRQPSPLLPPQSKLSSDFVVAASNPPPAPVPPAEGAGGSAGCGGGGDAPATNGDDKPAAGDTEATRPPPSANSKEKTPMCLVNELARYNKIKHQYRLTSETGPAHKKVFTVTLRLGDTEEYTAEGSSIKRAQHAAASAALSATSLPPPPPRAHVSHPPAHTHHRHAGAVMPTVELNALAMKLCQPAVYSSIPPLAAPPRAAPRPPRPYRLPPAPFLPPPHPHPPGPHPHPYQRMVTPGLIYRVRVSVGGRAWLGEGATPQAARHDAAARALHDLRPADNASNNGNNSNNGNVSPNADNENGVPGVGVGAGAGGSAGGGELAGAEVKSPVSLVHELALKRNLAVQFCVKSERGPPHMRVFVTSCTVGELETEGEGNGKKVSKRRAAERMLDEMRARWPPALLRARTHPPSAHRVKPVGKKKPRNLIKEGGVSCGGGAGGGGGADNPISRLAVARHAVRARSPQYRVLEERGAARRREFLVQCDAPPHSATGLGPNKKTAKRRAAHNVLVAMELAGGGGGGGAGGGAGEGAAGGGDAGDGNNNDKRKEGEPSVGAVGGGGGGGAGGAEVRQPVPGVLLMDYHQRSGQPAQPNGISETSAVGGAGGAGAGGVGAGGAGSSPGAKDQLMYLAQLLGFTVQFSDFPKRNHGEYLSLVSLSTEPPVMCHGGGPSTAHSHEQCARAALRALALMGLAGDAPPTGMQSLPTSGAAGGGGGGGGGKASVVNGLAE